MWDWKPRDFAQSKRRGYLRTVFSSHDANDQRGPQSQIFILTFDYDELILTR